GLLGVHRDLGDGLHGARDAFHALDLLGAGPRDALGQLGRGGRRAGDLLDVLLGADRDLVAGLDLARALFHRDHRFLRRRLHGADEGGDGLGRLGRALGQLANLVGDDAEAQAGLTGAGRLDGGVEGEQVRVRGQLFDQVDDLRDLERTVADALDLLGDDLHLAADPLHAGQAVAHGRIALLGGLERGARRAGRLLGGAGDFAHRAAHGLHRVTDG